MTTQHQRLTYKVNPIAASDGQEVDALADGYGRMQVIIAGGSITASPGPTGQQTMANSQPVDFSTIFRYCW